MTTRIGTIVIALALASGCKEDKPAGYGSPTPSSSTGAQAEKGPGPTQVRIERRPVEVGAVTTSEVSSTTHLELVGGGGNNVFDTNRRELRHIEVVEADGQVIRKAKVHYEAQTRAEREGAVEQEYGEPLHGQKVVVWFDGGKLAATTDSGAALAPELLEEVIKDLDDEIGVVPGVDRVLFGRDWTYGVPVTLGPDDLAALSSDMPRGTVATAGKLTAVKQSKGVASFQLDLTVEIGEVASNGFTVTSTATLEVAIAEGRRLRRNATSTLEGNLDGMKGQGTVSERDELRYRVSSPP